MILAATIWLLVFHFIIFRVYLTIVKAIILILKHATILRVSNGTEKALTLAEQSYQEAKIDLKVQEYFQAFTASVSVNQISEFIMATNFGLFMHLSITTNNILSWSSDKRAALKTTFGS